MVSGSEGDRRIGPDSLFRENDGLLWERHLSGDPSLYGAPMSHGHRVDGRIRATGKLASRNSYCSSLTISEYGLVDLADTTDEVTTDYNRKVASEHQASSYSLDRNKAATGLLHNCAAAHDSSQAWGGRHECKAEPDCVQDPKHAACTGVPRCKAEQPWSSDESKLDLHFERKAHCRSLKSAFEKAMVDSWYGKVSYPGETLSPVKSGYGFEDCLVIVDGLVDHDEEFTSQKGNFPSLNHTKNPYYEALSNLLHLHCWTNSNALKQQLASEKASPGIAPDVVACDGGRDLDLDRDVRRTLSDLSLKAWEPVTGGKQCERLQGVLQSLEQWWSSQYERMKHVSDRSALLLIADHQACLPFLLQHRFRVLAKSTMTLVEQPRSLSPRGSLSDSEGEKDMDLMGDGLDPGDPQLQDYQDLDHPQTPFYAIALNDEFADFTSPEYWKKVARRYVGKPKMVLKEWLFAHFDSPYPSDEDKAVLSEATGMGKTQVGNWFINARVRIWRPMIMEMGEDIEGDTGTKGQNTGLYVTGTQGDLQLLPRQPTSPSRHPSTLKPPKVKHDPYPPVTNPPTIVLTRLAPRGKAPPGFSRDGGESFGTHCCEGVVEGSDGEVGEVIVMDAKEQMEDCTLAQPTPQKRPRTSADTGGAQRQHVVETPWEQPQDPSSSSLGASAAAPTSSLHLNHGFAHLYSLWQEG